MRSLESPIFQLKMCLVIAVVIMTLAYHHSIRKDGAFWERTARRRAAAVSLAVVPMALWICIVFAGRWPA